MEKLDIVKGLAPRPYEFRAYKGSGLMQAVSTIMSEHNNLAIDSIGVCTWPYMHFIFHTIDKAAQMFSLVTGKDWDVDHILGIAERPRNVECLFDVRQGLTRETDSLPRKFFEKPLSKDKYKRAVLDKGKFEEMKDEYYMLRGRDPKTGSPTMEKITELGLSDTA